MNNNFFIGIDAGTTSIKGVLSSEEGKIVAVSMKEYALEIKDERCELDAHQYWLKTKIVIQDLLAESAVVPTDIRALSFSSQGETLICVDREGIPLRNAIVWLDNRSIAEAMAIE